jgi:DNA-binding response OmpR family regulator
MRDKPCILIVDDDPINIQLLSKALQKTYDICTAINGLDAISQVKEASPDLLILDVMMPDLSGFDVCQVIKAEEAYADIPILFLTAKDTIEAEITGLGLGGIDYLKKPVNLDLLKLRVRNHIELKRRNDLVKEQRDQLEVALSRIKQLEGIIPICMYCKKIRDDQQSWHQLETYISNHSEALFSHGICPHCLEEQKEIIKNLKKTTATL